MNAPTLLKVATAAVSVCVGWAAARAGDWPSASLPESHEAGRRALVQAGLALYAQRELGEYTDGTTLLPASFQSMSAL